MLQLDARQHAELAIAHAKKAIDETEKAKGHAVICITETKQSENCFDVLKSYFEGKAEKQKEEQQNQFVEIKPISKVLKINNQGDEELMKNITLRADGRYMGRRQINGHRVTVYAHTIKQCLEKLKKAEKQEKSSPKIKKTTYKLHDWLENWYETYKVPFIKYKSAKIIESTIKEIKLNIENINLTDLTTHRIQTFLNRYEKSRKKEFISLYFNASLQKAEDLNLISKNPFKAVVKERRLNVIRKPFNLEEQKKILQVIKGTEIEPVILFYLCTGIRKNELNTINIANDIDVKRHIIKIKSEKKRDREVYREIDVSNELIDLVLNHLNSFTLTTNQVYRKFKALLDKAGVQGSIHNLRHTFATNHFYLGTPAKIVQNWLGHEKIELTQNIYTHIDRSITKEDVLKLYNNLLFKI